MKKLLFSLLLLAAIAGHAQDTLRFATYTYGNNNRVANITPFANYFGNVVNLPVNVKSYASVSDLLKGAERHEVDIIFINTFGYLMLTEMNYDYSIAATLHVDSSKRNTYSTTIISSKKSGVISIEQLRDKSSQLSLLLVSPGSTSGNLIPRLKFLEIGISQPEKSFNNLNYSTRHSAALDAIVKGEADIAAFGSEELQKALAVDAALMSKVNVLWESPAIPLGPVLFSGRIDAAIQNKLISSLLDLHVKNPSALNGIKSGWTEALEADRFEIVGAEYYSKILSGNREESLKIVRAFAQ